jgi:hypothetical protein
MSMIPRFFSVGSIRIKPKILTRAKKEALYRSRVGIVWKKLLEVWDLMMWTRETSRRAMNHLHHQA